MPQQYDAPDVTRCMRTWGKAKVRVCRRSDCPHFAEALKIEDAVLKGAVDAHTIGTQLRKRRTVIAPKCNPSN